MKFILKKTIADPESTSGQRTVEVEAELERWGWGVIYKDGRELHQFGDDGTFHQIGEVDQNQIKMAVLYKTDDMKKRIDIPWREGMKLIHKYRNFIFEVGTEKERKARIIIFGYKYQDQFNLNYVLPDDRIVQSPEDDVDLTKFEI
jgi:hypothetical protein